jgi:hypothetical protein
MRTFEFPAYVGLQDKEDKNVHMFEIPAGGRIPDIILFGLCCYAHVEGMDCTSPEAKSVTVFYKETDPLYVTLPGPPPKEKS